VVGSVPRCKPGEVTPFRILSLKFQTMCRVAEACGSYVADLVQYIIHGKEEVIVSEGIYTFKSCKCQSKLLHGLRRELSSPTQTLESWV
jgi:hypothetical protein